MDKFKAAINELPARSALLQKLMNKNPSPETAPVDDSDKTKTGMRVVTGHDETDADIKVNGGEKPKQKINFIKIIVIGGIVYLAVDMFLPKDEVPVANAPATPDSQPVANNPEEPNKVPEPTVAENPIPEPVIPEPTIAETPVEPEPTIAEPTPAPEPTVAENPIPEPVIPEPTIAETPVEPEPTITDTTPIPEPSIDSTPAPEPTTTETKEEDLTNIFNEPTTEPTTEPVVTQGEGEATQVDTIPEQPKTDEGDLTTDILSDLEKKASDEKKKEYENVTSYTNPPDYDNNGRGLVYNCKGKHWACIDGPSYKMCERNYSFQNKKQKNKECFPKAVYQTETSCIQIQRKNVNSSASATFCN